VPRHKSSHLYLTERLGCMSQAVQQHAGIRKRHSTLRADATANGGFNLKYKIEIVWAVNWFTGGAQRHGTLRENPRMEELELAPRSSEKLVDGAKALHGQLVSCAC
jgi:hypothetical protein